MKTEMEDIIKRIKDRRTQLKYSFQDLADKTGMSKSTLQRYETGYIANVPLDKLEVLAKALEVSPAYLMGWEDEPPELSRMDIINSILNRRENEEKAKLGKIINKKNLELRSIFDIVKNQRTLDDTLLFVNEDFGTLLGVLCKWFLTTSPQARRSLIYAAIDIEQTNNFDKYIDSHIKTKLNLLGLDMEDAVKTIDYEEVSLFKDVMESLKIAAKLKIEKQKQEEQSKGPFKLF